MDNAEKLTTQGIQDKEKQNKNNPEKLTTQGIQDKEKQNTICVEYHYTQATTNNVNKTRVLLKTTGGKNIISYTL